MPTDQDPPGLKPLTPEPPDPQAKLFRLVADGTFYAESIDDAMQKLALHLFVVSRGEELRTGEMFTSGGILIEVYSKS